jgi:hypothetical protein
VKWIYLPEAQRPQSNTWLDVSSAFSRRDFITPPALSPSPGSAGFQPAFFRSDIADAPTTSEPAVAGAFTTSFIAPLRHGRRIANCFNYVTGPKNSFIGEQHPESLKHAARPLRNNECRVERAKSAAVGPINPQRGVTRTKFVRPSENEPDSRLSESA